MADRSPKILVVLSATRWLRLYGKAAHLRAVFAPHVSFRFVNRRGLRSPHDVERHGLISTFSNEELFLHLRDDGYQSFVGGIFVYLAEFGAGKLPIRAKMRIGRLLPHNHANECFTTGRGSLDRFSDC
jgi:hypothetical protein